MRRLSEGTGAQLSSGATPRKPRFQLRRKSLHKGFVETVVFDMQTVRLLRARFAAPGVLWRAVAPAPVGEFVVPGVQPDFADNGFLNLHPCPLSVLFQRHNGIVGQGLPLEFARLPCLEVCALGHRPGGVRAVLQIEESLLITQPQGSYLGLHGRAQQILLLTLQFLQSQNHRSRGPGAEQQQEQQQAEPDAPGRRALRSHRAHLVIGGVDFPLQLNAHRAPAAIRR